MSFHLVSTIARYEMRTLLRSWFFRIFVILVVVGLGIFNVAMNVEASGAPWVYKALAASIPYANLIILNLGQAIVAVFLASEFLKQDKKNDSVEVIYARSMSNGQYILGKTLGILAVFLVLNILVLLLGIGFSFLGSASSQNVLPYFMYPLLISLPTLVFILGLAFFVMVLVKNQAVTFIVLLGYIALTIFYLNKKAFHIFDYIAYQVPMMYSSINGFGNFTEILYHRLIYFLLGIGLIFLTVYRLQRLPQPPQRSYLSLVIGLLFLFLGGIVVNKYLALKYSVNNTRNQAVALNNAYSNYPRATILNCNLKLEHQNDIISAEASLRLVNNSSQSIDTLVLSLNMGLKIQELSYNQTKIPFKRNLQLILVKVPNTLKPGEEASLSLKYAGTVDEKICFLDKADSEDGDNFRLEVFMLRKRYAFLQDDYVCFTSEVLWYPIAGVGYASEKPMNYDPDFVKYTLQVKTKPGLTAISQGERRDNGKGTFNFTPEYPLPKLSLLIGNFKRKGIRVDSVDYEIYSIKGHDNYTESFKQIADTVEFLIRKLKQDYEAEIGFHYPYKRFILAEVPVHFALDKHEYSYSTDAVQPEMILYSEKGVIFSSTDFRNRRYRIEREMKRKNEEALPEEIQSRMFNQFVRNNFLAKPGEYYPFNDIVDWGSFSVFSQYYSFVSRLQSDSFPILSVALEAYFYERNMVKGSSAEWYDYLSKEERINLELADRSLQDILKKGILPAEDERNSLQLRDIVLAKGKHFFNILRARYGEKEVDTLLTQLTAESQFRKLQYAHLSNAFTKQFKTNLDSMVQAWYSQEKLPGFILSDISTYKVIKGEETKFQVKLTVTNPEYADGFITVNIEEKDPNRKNENWWENTFNADVSRKVFVPARSSCETGYLFNSEPARMSVVTHISRNLPYNVLFNFQGFNEIRNVPVLDGERSIPFISELNNAGEIIVDNEDRGFSFQQTTNQAYLKSLLTKNRKDRYKYTALQSWNPDREWKAVLRSEFYGKYVRSAYYTRAGTGDRKVFWKAMLPESGMYEVYFYMDKPYFDWRRSNKSPDYNLLVYHEGETEKINQPSEGIENGWLFLGTFSFAADTAKVELSNKSNGDMIFGDAVKWVKVK